ncbi:hypothetical protein EYF80_051090 [Liparis tanakae]|uniref:Uncharacterized protein n=1 Tax=Liparis tanakae TaxID=230148 RepID=A0A4Z2FD90_9TELE|nr:hypothetical protein EYF80_051090 [Liparis tanakae]
MSERFAFLLHWRRKHRNTDVSDGRGSDRGGGGGIPTCGHLADGPWALSQRWMQVTAAQGGQPVLARRRPRLEADGADVAFALFRLLQGGRGFGGRGHRRRLEETRARRGPAGGAGSSGPGAMATGPSSSSSSDSLTSVVLPDSGSAAPAAGARSRNSWKPLEGAAVWLG